MNYRFIFPLLLSFIILFPGRSFAAPIGPSSFFVASQMSGTPTIRVFNTSGLLTSQFMAYDSKFGGGVRLATGDVNGDGIPEIITGPGAGGGPQVRIFSSSGQVLGQFFAYDKSFRGGIFVTASDIDGDGRTDIIVSPGDSSKNPIKIFDLKGTLKHTVPIPTGFKGGSGIHVAVGDVDGDGHSDLILGPGTGGGSSVQVFKQDGTLIQSFVAYSPTFNRGILVSAGDVDGDGRTDIITGTGNGGGPQVRVFSGKNGQVLGSFFAYDKNFRGGVNVSVSDVNGDGKADILTGAGTGGSPLTNIYTNYLGRSPQQFPGFDVKTTLGTYIYGAMLGR